MGMNESSSLGRESLPGNRVHEFVNEFAGAGNHVFDPAGEPVRTADDRTYELDVENPPPSIVDPSPFFQRNRPSHMAGFTKRKS